MPGHGKKPIDISEFGRYAKELRRRASVLAALEKAARTKGVQTPEVMGQPMVEQSLQSIDRFILSCKRELGEI